jgi:hypothetical protein
MVILQGDEQFLYDAYVEERTRIAALERAVKVPGGEGCRICAGMVDELVYNSRIYREARDGRDEGLAEIYDL